MWKENWHIFKQKVKLFYAMQRVPASATTFNCIKTVTRMNIDLTLYSITIMFYTVCVIFTNDFFFVFNNWYMWTLSENSSNIECHYLIVFVILWGVFECILRRHFKKNLRMWLILLDIKTLVDGCWMKWTFGSSRLHKHYPSCPI